MKIALVHEFLNQLGGAERVLENFLEIWPDATIHVLIYDEDKTQGRFKNYRKITSFINSVPLAHSHPRLLIFLMPDGVENFKLDEYDLIISDSSSFAKGIYTKKLHICYCHTPTRYLWTAGDYLDKQPYPKFFRMLGKPVLNWLKKWDYAAAQRPNFFIANSRNIQSQIQKFYNRDSVVIPPPVDTTKFYPDGEKKDYFFTVSRLEPYKKTDLVIEAFNHLKLPLKVAGTGTDLVRLRSIAGPTIDFLGRINDEELRKRYSEAQAFVFAAEEDAGIAPLEAMACGTPVLAYGKGGVLETVIAGETGEFFDQQTNEALVGVLKSFEPQKYNAQKIREQALQYDKKVFQQKIKAFVDEKIQ